MEVNEIAAEVYKAIVQMYEGKLHRIGSVVYEGII